MEKNRCLLHLSEGLALKLVLQGQWKIIRCDSLNPKPQTLSQTTVRVAVIAVGNKVRPGRWPYLRRGLLAAFLAGLGV